MNIAEILLPIPLDGTFFYFIPDNISLIIGEYVLVSFGHKILPGIVTYIHLSPPTNMAVDVKKLKNINNKISLPIINSLLIDFIKWVSNYNIIPIGSLLKMVMGNVISAKSINKLENYNFKAADEQYTNIPINLSLEQNIAYSQIIEKIEGYSVTLLDGETGSGKTEVYCAVIKKLLHNCSECQVLILLPEIILASQLIKRIYHYFPEYHPIEWHSNLTPKKRRDNWLKITHGITSIIIGTRSALFLPYKNLKLIIVDEEHDTSFKQEQSIVYNARDMSVVRAKKENIPLILCSATPSLETINNAKKKLYYHILLTKRFGNSELPTVKIVDMRQNKAIDKWLSTELYEAIQRTIKNDNQVMLFLNRRGYAQLMLCQSCGFKINCPNCSTCLVEHKRKNKLLCHYCGYNRSIPNKCQNCSSESLLISYGIGIEKIAECIKNLIHEAKIAIISSDTNSQSINTIIESILNEEVNIIIGTQVIAKGHNFPKLTLVGVVDADLGLENCDLRATEKTYQILHQVSGRSGRYKEKGQVILQTYDPNNSIIKSLSSYQRNSFYELELKSRLLTNMPPYIRLIALIISSKNEVNAINTSNEITQKLCNHNLTLLGPAPAPISFLNKHYRYRILIKTKSNIMIQKSLKQYLEKYKKIRSVKITVDIDPINFM